MIERKMYKNEMQICETQNGEMLNNEVQNNKMQNATFRKHVLQKKLKSEQGTSIFFGLLLFLVASILSIVILNGAVTTVKTVASDRKAEQSQLTCSSAAQLLRDSIVNVKLSATVKDTIDREGHITNTEKNWSTPTVQGTTLETPPALAELLQEYAKSVDTQGAAAPNSTVFVTKKLTLSPQTSATATATTEGLQLFKELDSVSAEFTMTRNKSSETAQNGDVTYDIVVKLSTGTRNNSSHVILSLSGKVKSTLLSNQSHATSDTTSTRVTQYDYTWEPKDIYFGDQERTLEAS